MWRALSLLLVGCGPVLLGEEGAALAAGMNGGSDHGASGQGAMGGDGAVTPIGSGMQDAGAPPAVVVRIQPVGCGECFDLRAEASSGRPPYAFEWSDGVLGAERRVCVADAELALSVVARDADDQRSARHTLQLQRAASDAGCGVPGAGDGATDAPATAALCLMNPSFEGPPTQVDQGAPFDAAPWITCTNPTFTNLPSIGNETNAVTGSPPPPRDGVTYLALGEGQQVSQTPCSELAGGVPVHLEIDLSRINLGGDIVPQTEQVWLEIRGGLSADCAARELLWASPPLEVGWKTFCATLRPSEFMNLLTLRANADMTLASPAYLLVDNLRPVSGCP